MNRSRAAWIAALIAYAAVIFVVSSLPIRSAGPFDRIPRGDWLLHAAEFALFYVLAYKATQRGPIALLLTLLYAGTDEVHQAFVPVRDASLADFGFDLLGAAAMATGIAACRRFGLLGTLRRRILGDRAGGKGKGT